VKAEHAKGHIDAAKRIIFRVEPAPKHAKKNVTVR
jgi:hypothetical protein